MRKVNINAASIFCAVDELGRLRMISAELQQKLIQAATKYRKNKLGRRRFDDIDLQATVRITILGYKSAIARDPREIEMEAISKCPDKGILAEIIFEEKHNSSDWKFSIRGYKQRDD